MSIPTGVQKIQSPRCPLRQCLHIGVGAWQQSQRAIDNHAIAARSHIQRGHNESGILLNGEQLSSCSRFHASLHSHEGFNGDVIGVIGGGAAAREGEQIQIVPVSQQCHDGIFFVAQFNG